VTVVEVVDSHHHLWDPGAFGYKFLEDIDELRRPFTAEDFEEEVGRLGISWSICVEAASAGADGRRETTWLLRQMESSARIAALIAWAPLERADLGQYLDWLSSLEAKPIVGIRRSFEFESDDFPEQRAVIEGAGLAGERGFVVDLVLFSRSLAATIALVEACPQTQFVLDHLGKPPVREGRFEPWASELRELAARPNVVCKLSGIPVEANRMSWTTTDVRPYVEHGLDCFGAERLLFGTDWPVVNRAGGAGRWFASVGELLEHWGQPARAAVLADNARRVYGLGAKGCPGSS
jgi:L-fuconolactonase